VRRRGGVDDQGLCVSDVGQVRCQIDILDECLASVAAALDAETYDRACTLRQVFFREFMTGMRGQVRVADPGYLVVIQQVLEHLRGIGRVFVHAQ